MGKCGIDGRNWTTARWNQKREYNDLLQTIHGVEQECKRVKFENKVDRELNAKWNEKLEVS